MCNQTRYRGNTSYYTYYSQWSGNLLTGGTTHTVTIPVAGMPNQGYWIETYCYDGDWNYGYGRTALRINRTSANTSYSAVMRCAVNGTLTSWYNCSSVNMNTNLSRMRAVITSNSGAGSTPFTNASGRVNVSLLRNGNVLVGPVALSPNSSGSNMWMSPLMGRIINTSGTYSLRLAIKRIGYPWVYSSQNWTVTPVTHTQVVNLSCALNGSVATWYNCSGANLDAAISALRAVVTWDGSSFTNITGKVNFTLSRDGSVLRVERGTYRQGGYWNTTPFTVQLNLTGRYRVFVTMYHTSQGTAVYNTTWDVAGLHSAVSGLACQFNGTGDWGDCTGAGNTFTITGVKTNVTWGGAAFTNASGLVSFRFLNKQTLESQLLRGNYTGNGALWNRTYFVFPINGTGNYSLITLVNRTAYSPEYHNETWTVS
ncbi:hypothetical protein COY95_01440 [Candidatus Woesearchaeota archaeon CG_4_10_14_0_8_um_filter_47_5]|nr:MAG: hypothetical protein COY95_01440 [Candidatus Woesearchaeota archaeon CG_4_10_14_0_8_um_filter_47_5]